MFTALMMVSSMSARSVRDMWVSMPDSMVEYLTANQRLELVELKDMKVKATVTNELQSETVLDTLTSDYMKVVLSEASVLELKMLPANGDSILCMIQTFLGPEKESVVLFYDQAWNKQNIEVPVPDLLVKPDTMTSERFEELKGMIEPLMSYAEMEVSQPVITFKMSMPLVGNEEKKAIQSIAMQRKFKWDGSLFKEY